MKEFFKNQHSRREGGSHFGRIKAIGGQPQCGSVQATLQREFSIPIWNGIGGGEAVPTYPCNIIMWVQGCNPMHAPIEFSETYSRVDMHWVVLEVTANCWFVSGLSQKA